MRQTPWITAEPFRWHHPAFEAQHYGDACGSFLIPHPPTAVTLKVIASTGEGWDHVSVSLPKRTPNWTEMEFVKRLFFADHETAMQLHVPPSDHRNCHPFCLHIWRPQNAMIPRPPGIMVAPDE